ncbi:MAG: IS30 family transposase [Phascolarctobacterium sp.]|uniref:IS30 family transposase n=1 Tax=Phascolarctobacterium sp. TaxID=2049039 RepID=UPI0026DBF212|nr:IS30 family transposase [Phascolarctobacterium sp.]MDO4921404.1 IS30 family transposase [Phascolarctobacterium sp.]
MDQVYSTTNEHKKGQHLSKDERILIEIRLKDGWTPNRIAKEIGCAPNTIRNEIKRGTVSSPKGKSHRYKANAGQAAYEQNRQASRRNYDRLEKDAFIQYVEQHFFEDKWSLDSCVGRALQDGSFSREQIVCVKTLYNYIGLGLLGIKNIDLPEKLKRSPKKAREREAKRVLGRSIEERDKEIEARKEFGHWECDLVIGSKSDEDDALLTMLERMSREFLVIRLPGKDAQSVMQALEEIRSQYSEHWNEIFKTITTDNGSEFAKLSDLEGISKTLVYFAHPYTSCEKGSIERHNGLLRRFIPKGKRIDSYSNEQLCQIEIWCNSLPRRILGYKTSDEVFEAELDKIYGFAA